jgi:hypothetical protein
MSILYIVGTIPVGVAWWFEFCMILRGLEGEEYAWCSCQYPVKFDSGFESRIEWNQIHVKC